MHGDHLLRHQCGHIMLVSEYQVPSAPAISEWTYGQRPACQPGRRATARNGHTSSRPRASCRTGRRATARNGISRWFFRTWNCRARAAPFTGTSRPDVQAMGAAPPPGSLRDGRRRTIVRLRAARRAIRARRCREGARARAGRRSGDGLRSVRVRPSSLKHDFRPQGNEDRRSCLVQVHAKSYLTPET